MYTFFSPASKKTDPGLLVYPKYEPRLGQVVAGHCPYCPAVWTQVHCYIDVVLTQMSCNH